MITTAGKGVVKSVFSMQVPQLATSMALGVGNTTEQLTDLRLTSEVIRVPVSTVSPDPSSDRVVFKSVVSPGIIGTVYEVGLFLEDNSSEQSRTLGLSEASSIWTNATVVAGGGRANLSTVKIDFVANGTTNAELPGLIENFSGFASTDNVVLSFTATANLSSLRVRLGTDAANYYEFTVASPIVGYNIHRLNISTATKVGTPDWAAVTYLAIRPSASAAGSGSVNFDNLRFEHSPALSGSILVARKVLATPFTLDTAIPSEIEYSVGVNVT